MEIQQGAQSFYFDGGSTGCLLLHGFTSTPYDVRWLGEHLHQAGCTVYAPRLTGHGTTIRDLNRAKWQQWVYNGLDGLAVLREHCDTVLIIGFSMGGALAMLLAAHEPVQAIVTMGAPRSIETPYKRLIPVINRALPSVPKTHLPDPEDDIFQQGVRAYQQQRGEEPFGMPFHRRWPLKALNQMFMLLAQMRAVQSQITVPALLLHGRNDLTIPVDHLQRNAEALINAPTQTRIFENSGHVLPMDAEREQVFEAVTTFIQEEPWKHS